MLRLMEDEFRFYGSTVALRRLPRTSCPFAKFLPEFAAFRAAVGEVRTLQAISPPGAGVLALR